MSPETRRIMEGIGQVLQHLLLDEPEEARRAFRDFKTRLQGPPRTRTHCPFCYSPLQYHPSDNRSRCPACGRSLHQPKPTETNQPKR